MMNSEYYYALYYLRMVNFSNQCLRQEIIKNEFRTNIPVLPQCVKA